MKIILFIMFFSAPLLAEQYCILRIDELSARSVKINQTCNGKSKLLFFNNGARDLRLSKVSSILGSYPIEEVSDKVESFTLSVFLKDGFKLKGSQRLNHKKSFILLK